MTAALDLHAELTIARDPQTSPDQLRALASRPEPELRAQVACNPNAPLDLLLGLLPSCPDAILENPALELLDIEAPGSLNSLPAEALIALLTRPLVPAWLAVQLLASPHLRTDQRLVLAASPTTPPTVLLALASAEDITARCEVARNTALPAEGAARLAADPQPEVRAALACSTSDAATLATLAADAHPSPRLFARSRLEKRPEGPVTPRPLDVGRATALGQRQHNEDDSFFGPVPGGYLALVTDGMGGQRTGDIAARLAAREIPAALAMILPFSSTDEESSCLAAAIAAAHEAIGRLQKNRSYTGMGATVAAVLLCEDRIHLAHVGDSRVYRRRQGALELLTRDHSLFNDYMDALPGLSPEQIADIPRNVITRALGIMPNPVVPDRKTLPIEPQDVFLVCTDGLHGTLTSEQMNHLLDAHAGDAASAAQALADAAEKAGSEDNITVVIVDTAPRAHLAESRS